MSKSEQSIVRANAILQLLKNTDRSLHNLALICNVSVRTIQRDVDYLTSLGCPIVMDSETKEYRLVNDPGIPPINFTQSEVLAIMVLFSQFGGQIEEPIFAAAQTAILKFASFIPPNLLKAFCKIGPYMQIQPKKTNIDVDYHEIFDVVLQSLFNRRVVAFDYNSVAERGRITTNFHPYAVTFVRSWYAIGYSSLHREVRTFKLSRVQKVSVKDKAYEIPVGFALKKYLRNAWRLIPEPGNDQEVVVQFSSKVAANASEIRWHPTQEERVLDDGRRELRFTVSGLNEIAWWILGYGSEARVVQPRQLQEIIVRHARKMIELYEK